MGEEWMVVSAFPTQQQGADLGSCFSPVGATVMVKSLILYVNRICGWGRGYFEPKLHSPSYLVWNCPLNAFIPQIFLKYFLGARSFLLCVCITCFNPNRQCGPSACISCPKGISILGKWRGTHQKHPKADSAPEGVGRSVVKVFVCCHIAERAKVENGKRSCL